MTPRRTRPWNRATGFGAVRRRVGGVVLAVSLTFVAAGCAFPGDSIVDGEGIVGVYTVNGIDPTGVEYSGTVIIASAVDAGEYLVTWLVTGGVQEGVGRLVGNRFTVDWTTTNGGRGGSRGSATYVLEPDGALIGERTVVGLAGSGTEEIYPRG